MKSSTGIIITVIVVIFLCLMCCICLIAGIGIWTMINSGTSGFTQLLPAIAGGTPTSTPLVIRPTPSISPTAPVTTEDPDPTPSTAPESPVPPPTETAEPFGPVDNLKVLENSIVPINDPLDLALRLEGRGDLPRSLEGPPQVYQIGEERSFWVTNTDTNENSQVPATLRYSTEHVYFWIANGVDYDQGQLEELVDTFEEEIYPTNRAFFGSEWTPGVDADPHLHILFARGLGGNVAGYFSTVDELLPVVRPDSNGHEMFLLSAEKLKLDNAFLQLTKGIVH